MRKIITNLDGTITDIDERVFSLVKEAQLKYIRQRAMDLILAQYPEFKQRNAALGLLSSQEIQDIKDFIQQIRTISNQKEAAIESIVWDGNEATRKTACDSVEQISWD